MAAPSDLSRRRSIRYGSLHLAIVVALCATALPVDAQPAAENRLAYDAPVLALALASSGQFLAIGIEDPKDSLVPAVDGDLDAWFLHEIFPAATAVRQSGGADPPVCREGLNVEDDCDSNVAHVAVDGTGQRMVATAVSDLGETTIVFIDQAKGELRRFSVPGIILGLHFTDDGQRATLLLDRSASPQGGSDVRSFAWDGQAVAQWHLDAAAHSLHANDHGNLFVAAEEAVYFLDRSGSITRDSWSPYSITSAAMAASSRWAIASNEQGAVRIYGPGSNGIERLLHIPASDDLTAVAISPDGGQVALAGPKGVKLLELIHDPPRLGRLHMDAVLDTPVNQLLYGDAGQYLVAAGPNSVDLFAAQDPGQHVWRIPLEDQVSAVSFDDKLDRLAIAAGQIVEIMPVEQNVTLRISSAGPATPGTDHKVTVTATNSGHKRLMGDLELNITAQLENATQSAPIRLLPGQSKSIAFTVPIPAHWPPGAISASASISSGSATGAITVATRENWAVLSGSSPFVKPIKEGGFAEFRINVRNDGNIPAFPHAEAEAPDEWRIEIKADHQLLPGEQGTIVARLHAPPKVPHLTRAIAYIHLPGPQTIEVEGVVGAAFEPSLHVPITARAPSGDPVILQGSLRNSGNVMDSFYLTTLTAPKGLEVRFDGGLPDRGFYRIAPGSEHAFTIELRRSGMEGPTSGSITLQATSFADPETISYAFIDVTDSPSDERKAPAPGILLSFLLVLAAILQRRLRS